MNLTQTFPTVYIRVYRIFSTQHIIKINIKLLRFFSACQKVSSCNFCIPNVLSLSLHLDSKKRKGIFLSTGIAIPSRKQFSRTFRSQRVLLFSWLCASRWDLSGRVSVRWESGRWLELWSLTRPKCAAHLDESMRSPIFSRKHARTWNVLAY